MQAALGDAEAVSGLAEALRHVERIVALWDDVPAAEKLAGMDLPAILAWAAELADLTGAGLRAATQVAGDRAADRGWRHRAGRPDVRAAGQLPVAHR